MEKQAYQFGAQGNVHADTNYLPGKFGFLTEKERAVQPEEKLFELSSGFAPPYWYADEPLTRIRQDTKSCWLDSDAAVKALWEKDGTAPAQTYFVPLCFKTDMPGEGNYRVTVELTARKEEENLLIFHGCRHLVWKGALHQGEKLRKSFTVHTAATIPNEKGVVCTRNYLNLAVVGHCPTLEKLTIEPINCPTLYLAGDSTMADYAAEYPYHAAACYGGWGQALELYLNGNMAVCNQAHNGRTTESFRMEGHYDLVMERIRPEDYFLIEFGHNDQKHAHLQAHNGYPANLKRFIAEIRAKGAYPLLATPIARNTWLAQRGKAVYHDLLCEHSQACFAVGHELNVPVLDVHGQAMAEIVRLGQGRSSAYYHVGDQTHTNDYGAVRAAGYAARAVKNIGHEFPEYQPLRDAIAATEQGWEPVPAPLLAKPARLKDRADPNAQEGKMDAQDHQAEKDGAARLIEAVRAAKEAAKK